jgi:hypothetical protein
MVQFALFLKNKDFGRTERLSCPNLMQYPLLRNFKVDVQEARFELLTLRNEQFFPPCDATDGDRCRKKERQGDGIPSQHEKGSYLRNGRGREMEVAKVLISKHPELKVFHTQGPSLEGEFSPGVCLMRSLYH